MGLLDEEIRKPLTEKEANKRDEELEKMEKEGNLKPTIVPPEERDVHNDHPLHYRDSYASLTEQEAAERDAALPEPVKPDWM